MKHHVFFFLLIFSSLMHAMNKNEQKIISMIERCRTVNQYCPGTYDIQELEKTKKELMTLPYSEQKKILKTARNFVPLYIEKVEERVVFFWDSNGKNEYTSNNRIY